jgi:hypothetical protein
MLYTTFISLESFITDGESFIFNVDIFWWISKFLCKNVYKLNIKLANWYFSKLFKTIII